LYFLFSFFNGVEDKKDNKDNCFFKKDFAALRLCVIWGATRFGLT